MSIDEDRTLRDCLMDNLLDKSTSVDWSSCIVFFGFEICSGGCGYDINNEKKALRLLKINRKQDKILGNKGTVLEGNDTVDRLQ